MAQSMRASVRVLDGGKVTIPEPVRDELGVEKGKVVQIEVTVP